MQIGKVWIYHLLFVFYIFMVTDLSAEDKASGIKFCRVVYWHPRHRICNFGELCSPRSPKLDESARTYRLRQIAHIPCAMVGSHCTGDAGMHTRHLSMCRIGMCGYMAIPKDGHTCYIELLLDFK